MAHEIGEWLEGLGLGRYAQAFADNEIDLDALPHITDEDLKEIGVGLGARRKLLAAIAAQSSPAGVSDDRALSVPLFISPQSYTPKHLAEKILGSRGALEGERKQVTVLFADIKGSLELIESGDAEAAHALLDPAIKAMMDAVHRYEGTVNKMLGDGIMALFGAPASSLFRSRPSSPPKAGSSRTTRCMRTSPLSERATGIIALARRTLSNRATP